MIVKLFKNQSPINLVLLIILIIILRLPYFLNDQPIPVFNYSEPLSKFLFNKLSFLWVNKSINIIITSVIYLILAVWLNKIVSDFTLLFKNSFLPALLFIVITSLFPTFFTIDAAILVIFFQLLIFVKLFKLYKSNNALTIAFDVGMIVSIASLFYFPSIAWVLLLWMAMFIFRPFNWREFFTAFVGVLTPYLFVAFYYFWIDDFGAFMQIWQPIKNNAWQINVFPNSLDYLPLLPLVLILLVASNRLRENFYKNVVHVRKCQQLLITSIFVTGISFYIKPSFSINHFILLAAPFSVFLSYYFLVAKKNWMSEGLFLLLILSILYFQIR